MSVALTNNFLHNARGLVLADGGGITWAIDRNTNAITGTTGSGGGISGANPTAKVGLTAVSGTAPTYIRSDGAPPIDQTIAPTWTGTHTFEASTGASWKGVNFALYELANIGADAAGSVWFTEGYTSPVCGRVIFGDGSGWELVFAHRAASATTDIATLTDSGALSLAGAIGVNGVNPPAKVTGWGTPTGASVQANFAGASATLAQCGAAIAKIITDLKALGLYAA